MCWRGHSESERNNLGKCRACHRLRVRLRRHGREPIPCYRYQINPQALRKTRKLFVNADLAGIPRPTFDYWIHGNRHIGKPCLTTKKRALAVAENLNIPFDKLWRLLK